MAAAVDRRLAQALTSSTCTTSVRATSKVAGADAQIEFPVAQELLVVAQRPDLAFRALHPHQPFAQGAGIVLAEAEGAGEFQPRLFGFLAKARQDGSMPPGKT